MLKYTCEDCLFIRIQFREEERMERKAELLLSRAKQSWQDSWNISAPFVRKMMPLRQKTAERKNSIPLRWAVR